MVLETENSAYRIVKGLFVQVTSENELQSIKEAIDESDPFPGVKTHLTASLQHLSDRKNPDYRNSIKESISAVESICQTVTGEKKATLAKALNKLDQASPIHKALIDGFIKIYGFTNDAGGIRHALSSGRKPSHSDAKFMLIACSAFINYIIGKIAEDKIELPEKDY